MSTQCGLYLQKLLHTQSIYLTNKSALATNDATTPTLPSFQPGTTLIQHNNTLNDNTSVSLFDDVLFVEDLKANDNLNTVVPQDQRTVDSHTNEQYFECKL